MTETAHFRKFFDLSLDLLVVGTVEGRFLHMSTSWTTVLGWSKEELYKLSAPEMIHPDDLARTVEVVERILRGEGLQHFENRYRHKNGSWVWLSWTGVFSPEDQLFYAIAKDVTEIRKIEARLKQSEKHLKEAQKIANVGSWELCLDNMTDINANPLFWSDQVFRIFGYEPGDIEVSNDNFFKSVHPDDREKIQAAVAAAIETKSDYSIEHRIVRPDGTERIVHERSKITYDEKSGRPVFMAGTVEDITEQKKLQKQLMEAQKMESIGRLAGGIAHDFNNMLAIIYGNLGLIEPLITEDQPIYKYIKGIESTAERAAQLTNQLLAFNRQKPVSRKAHDLNEIVRSTDKMLRRLIGADVDMEMRLENDIGPVEVDSGQIVQVILNLAVNARDAMPEGGKLRISTSKTPDGSFAKLLFSDTGHGMDPETMEKIFDPFFTTKPAGRGTGLGLSTVYGIVKQCGGSVSVTSQLGQGSNFEIQLPISNKAPTAESATATSEKSIPKGRGQRILLVEDDKEVRLLLQNSLEQNGYLVWTADNGKNGLSLVNSRLNELDLLITDLVMPGISGLNLVRQARTLKPSLPIICISGYFPEEAEETGIPNIIVLKKPFHFPRLLAEVEKSFELPR